MTQNEMILARLERGRTITRMEAGVELKIWNLPARIQELRRDHNIETEMVTNGRVRYARYRLVK